MGRRGDAIASVRSDPSTESSFRELDEAFLQTQTRIWLGEVLNIRLGEDFHISDLLADGELLFEVAKVLWNLLLTKCSELWHLKANLKGPVISRKSGGRYKPYSNVDSFLKICKILGLNGIDLFSPSDVVERKNTRKVCICIRALSKKARSKQLKVPDFDIVTYTVVMPTDMVGCIRRSLESSQSSFSSSSSYSSRRQSIKKLRQKTFIPAGDRNYDSCSEDSDEVESNYMVANNNVVYDAASISNLKNSPGAYSANKAKQCTAGLRSSQYHIEDQDFPEYQKGQFKSQSISGSVKSEFERVSNEHSVHGSELNKRGPCQNGDIRGRQSKTDQNFDIPIQNDDLGTGGNMGRNVAERDYISEYLAFSDSVVFGVDGSSPVLQDEEDSSFNFFMGIDAHGSEFKGRDSDVDDEVSSTTSMSSVLGRVLCMEFDDGLDLDGSSSTKGLPKVLLENKNEENQGKGSMIPQEMDENFTSDAKGQQNLVEESIGDGDTGLVITGRSMFGPDAKCDPHTHAQLLADSCSNCSEDSSSSCNMSSVEGNKGRIPCPSQDGVDQHLSSNGASGIDILLSGYVPSEEMRPSLTAEILDDGSEVNHQPYSSVEDDKIDKDINKGESASHLIKDVTSELPRAKPHQKLLKTVAKGTAVIGVLFLLLQVRKKAGGKNVKEDKKSVQKYSFRQAGSLSQKAEKEGGRVGGVYPAGKLGK